MAVKAKIEVQEKNVLGALRDFFRTFLRLRKSKPFWCPSIFR